MQWSQLKKRVESLFAEKVQGRVELHTTRYHRAPDEEGRAWITIDKRQIINMCSWSAHLALWREATQLQTERGCTDFRAPEQIEGYHQAYREARDVLHDNAIFSREEFHAALFQYLNMSIDDALASPNHIIRGIAMLDRRIGKRRIALLESVNEHPLVRELDGFRRRAEGLSQEPD